MATKQQSSFSSRPSDTISLAGLERQAFGGTSSIYMLSKDTLLKAYPDSFPQENVIREWRRANSAYELAIPSAQPLELVQIEDEGYGLGIIFERLRGITLAEKLMTGQTSVEEVAERLGHFMRELHSIKLSTHAFEDQQEVFATYARRLSDKDVAVLQKEEAKELERIYRLLPKTTGFLHGDLHAANVIETTGELFLIDMEGAGYGHPVLDWAGTWQALHLIPTLDPTCCETYVSLDAKTATSLLRPLMQTYFNCTDDTELDTILRALEAFGIAKYACMIVRDPNPWINRAEVAAMLRERVLSRSSIIEDAILALPTF